MSYAACDLRCDHWKCLCAVHKVYYIKAYIPITCHSRVGYPTIGPSVISAIKGLPYLKFVDEGLVGIGAVVTFVSWRRHSETLNSE